MATNVAFCAIKIVAYFGYLVGYLAR